MTDQIVCLEGNGSRPSHHGDGWIVSDVMYTLNSTEIHIVCYRNETCHMKLDNPQSDIKGVAVVEVHHNGKCRGHLA